MQALQNEKAIKYLAVTVTFMVCVARVSMAVGQIANGVALLLGLYLWYKNKNTFRRSQRLYKSLWRIRYSYNPLNTLFRKTVDGSERIFESLVLALYCFYCNYCFYQTPGLSG